MPWAVPAAVKARRALEEKESCMQKALEEYFATQHDPAPPTHAELASKHGVAKSTLSARINGRPSKLVTAGKWQKILPDEEKLLVNYLQETARRGFPDTQKRCILRANEILRIRSGNRDAKVGACWLDRFLQCHHDKI